MNDIALHKPIVLRSRLNDMNEREKAIASALLENRKFLIFEKGHVKIIDSDTNPLPDTFYYGSEAVSMYRQLLGLPSHAITTIHVMDIFDHIDDYNTMKDILFLLYCVHIRNDRFKKLCQLDAPSFILQNEYRVLNDRVEFLQNNNWCNKPFVNCYKSKPENETEEPKDIEEPLKSLTDIGYFL